VPVTNFHRKDAKVTSVTMMPFYWGFDLGMSVPEEQMYQILKVIEQHADELAKADPSFLQIGGGQMAAFQKKALETNWNLVPIHPGLAKFLREKKMWDSVWDSNVAKVKS
jgi:TRAP-type uncharacterized transport system substrate-binding protein